MKIGIVSDTHCRPLPKQLLEDFKKVDFIIHAGDFCSIEDLEALKRLKEVKAVHGNMDSQEIRKIFPAKLLFKCGILTVGIFHGAGSRQHNLERVQQEFRHDKVDVVVFGHSHEAFNEKVGKVLYFNPGSPNDPMAAIYSYGTIEIKDKEAVGKIIRVKEYG